MKSLQPFFKVFFLSYVKQMNNGLEIANVNYSEYFKMFLLVWPIYYRLYSLKNLCFLLSISGTGFRSRKIS